uniref:Glucose-methanol-choline oxidoreductase C-terminal domain-containing protein n=1 Tax=Moniliophthora roreri TaxID=221103 RepID=A0A0W0FJW9_MONRR
MADVEAGNPQYWHDGGNGNFGWRPDCPSRKEIRVPGVIHESSTLYMGPGSEPHAAVDENYRPYGCQNIYVTEAGLFPSAGSWNPTLTMCGFAQDLARKVAELDSYFFTGLKCISEDEMNIP